MPVARPLPLVNGHFIAVGMLSTPHLELLGRDRQTGDPFFITNEVAAMMRSISGNAEEAVSGPAIRECFFLLAEHTHRVSHQTSPTNSFGSTPVWLFLPIGLPRLPTSPATCMTSSSLFVGR